jgi:hypothetical protein
VRQNQCFFDSNQRRSYIETGRKFGGPFEWGRPLPKSIREAKQRYLAVSRSRPLRTKSAAYDVGLIYLLGLDGIRDETSAHAWFGKCSNALACRENKEMLEYKWQHIGKDDTELLKVRGSR